MTMSNDYDGITAFPPVLQVAAVTLLGLYVTVSILGRVVPAMEFVWRDRQLIRDRAHVAKYTLTPLLVFAGLAIIVSAKWDSTIPWHGGWPIEDLVKGPGLIVVALVLFSVSHLLLKVIDTSDAGRWQSWIPFTVLIAAMASMVVGILRLT